MIVHKYKLAYNVLAREKGYTKEWLAENGMGGCDSLVLVSIIGEPGNGECMSTVLISAAGDDHKDDGELRSLTPQQEFIIWADIAGHLMSSLQPNSVEHAMVQGVLNLVRQMPRARKGRN